MRSTKLTILAVVALTATVALLLLQEQQVDSPPDTYSGEMASASDRGPVGDSPELSWVSSEGNADDRAAPTVEQPESESFERSQEEIQLELRVMTGIADRSELGDEFVDEILFRKARSSIAVPCAVRSLAWRAAKLGFERHEEADAYESLVASGQAKDAALFLSLRDLVDAALPEYEQAAVDAWDSGRRVEAMRVGVEHDAEEWRLSQGIHLLPKGVLHELRSIRWGDTAFRLHVLSAEFPQLEHLLLQIDTWWDFNRDQATWATRPQ